MNLYQAALVRERDYSRDIRLAAVAALVLVTFVFLFVKPPHVAPYTLRSGAVAIKLDPIDTRVFDAPKPRDIARPKLPVADPMGKAVDSSVGQNDWDDTATTHQLNVPDLEPVDFFKVEVKPRPVHVASPSYPELARMAGIEGNVVTRALVDTSGMVMAAEVLASSGNSALDAAAVEAAQQCRFTPALQRDRRVRVWVAIPFSFRLR